MSSSTICRPQQGSADLAGALAVLIATATVRQRLPARVRVDGNRGRSKRRGDQNRDDEEYSSSPSALAGLLSVVAVDRVVVVAVPPLLPRPSVTVLKPRTAARKTMAPIARITPKLRCPAAGLQPMPLRRAVAGWRRRRGPGG